MKPQQPFDPGALAGLPPAARGSCPRIGLPTIVAMAVAIAEVPAVLAEVLNAHLSGFSKAEWQTLQGYLRRMLATGEALREAD